MAYREKEQAVIDVVYAAFDTWFDNKDQVVSGEVDKLMQQLAGMNKKYGCLLDFGGGAHRTIEPFNKRVWVWTILGVLIIKYQADNNAIEDEVREAVEKLATLFVADHTLGGITPLVRIERIDQPEVVQLNDIPMYWLGFEVSVIEGPDY